MKKKMLSLAVFTLINIACFYLMPAVITDTGSAMGMLLLVVPLCCLIISVVYGALNAFNIAYPIMVALVFIPTIWIYFNESAWVYSPAYGVIALIGNAIGAGIYHFRNKQSNTEI